MSGEYMRSETEYIQQLLSSVWPGWKVIKRLGRGTYGAVYEIMRDDLGSGYRCALKVLQMQVDEADGEDTVELTRNVYDPGVRKNPSVFSQGALDPAGPAHVRSQGELDPAGPGLIRSQRTSPLLGDPAVGSPYRPFQAFAGGEESLEEFVRSVSEEIDLMVQVKGAPGIVSIEDYAVLRGRGSRTILIRMEELESIDHYFSRLGFVTQDEVIRLGTDICTALSFCERSNILHRDIKPGNLFYSDRAGFKLGDFGISRKMDSIHEKMAMSGVGTMLYMAPEIYQGQEYNNTVDIYSLGIVLYTLMNDNIPPFYPEDGRKSPSGTGWDRVELNSAMMRRLKGEKLPRPARADDRLGAVICRACDPDPKKRYQTAEAFRNALQICLSAQEPPRGPVGDPPAGSWPKSPMILLIAGLTVLVISAVLLMRGNANAGSDSDTDSSRIYIDPEEDHAAAEQLREEMEASEEAEQKGQEAAEEAEQEGQEAAEDAGQEGQETAPAASQDNDQAADSEEQAAEESGRKTPVSVAYNTRGTVSILCKKYESDQLQRLIDSFSKESGIQVTAQVTGSGGYSSRLEQNVTGSSSGPSLFMLSGSKDFEKYGFSCLDITDSAAVQELTDSSPALRGTNGKIYGLPCLFESYGLTVNTRLLEQAGYTVEDLTSFDNLKWIARDITSRKKELGFSAFTVPSIGSGVSGSYRFSEHAPAVPLFYELRDNDFNTGTALQGTYMDRYKEFVDLYLSNCTMTGQNLTGHTLEESQREFLQEKAVFHQDGSWDYDTLRGILDGNAAVIPLYMGIPGEEIQGLNKTCSYFWCVNKYASEDDLEATLQFLQWMTTSEESLRIMTQEMGFAVPFRRAEVPVNLYLQTLREEEEAGMVPVNQYYKSGNYTAWINAFDHAIEDYASGSGSWEAVRQAFVSLW